MSFPRRPWKPAELDILRQCIAAGNDARGAYLVLMTAGYSRSISSVQRRWEIEAEKAKKEVLA